MLVPEGMETGENVLKKRVFLKKSQKIKIYSKFFSDLPTPGKLEQRWRRMDQSDQDEAKGQHYDAMLEKQI